MLGWCASVAISVAVVLMTSLHKKVSLGHQTLSKLLECFMYFSKIFLLVITVMTLDELPKGAEMLLEFGLSNEAVVPHTGMVRL